MGMVHAVYGQSPEVGGALGDLRCRPVLCGQKAEIEKYFLLASCTIDIRIKAKKIIEEHLDGCGSGYVIVDNVHVV